MGVDAIREMVDNCILARARILSRVITGVYDEVLSPFEINSSQFALLVAISHLAPATRSDIGRYTQQDRSTLSRNIKLLEAAGWVEIIATEDSGRRKPLGLTKAGTRLLQQIAPAWREGQARAAALLGAEEAQTVFRIGDALFGPVESE